MFMLTCTLVRIVNFLVSQQKNMFYVYMFMSAGSCSASQDTKVVSSFENNEC